MNIEEFIIKYNSEKEMFMNYGVYIKETIINNLMEQYNHLDTIIKIPVEPRVKQIDSLLAKAFYRGKNYKDPYQDITDKVGIRFVVLTIEQIGIIKSIIEKHNEWMFSEDVDFERNKDEAPELFTYQSVHYIVRAKADIRFSENIILKNTPCEIQIRTLLQHAYAELSHDTVYKKNKDINPKIKRKMARSMALIEATDELFKEVQNLLLLEDEKYTSFINKALQYSKFNDMTDNLNRYIYHALEPIVLSNSIDESCIDNIIKSKPYIIKTVEEKKNYSIIYRQPIVYLLYYLINNSRYNTMDLWPLSDDVIEPLFIDLGISSRI